MMAKDCVITQVFSLNVSDTVRDAIDVFTCHNPSLISVLREGKVVGLITHRDLSKIEHAMASWNDVHLIREENSEGKE